MIVELEDGQTRRTRVTDCTGYRASELRLDGVDFRELVRLMNRDPQQFRAVLEQLSGRFPVNRASTPRSMT